MTNQTQTLQLKYVNETGTRVCMYEQLPGCNTMQIFYDIVDGKELRDRSYSKMEHGTVESFQSSADFEMNYYNYELVSSLNIGTAFA